MSRHHAVPVDVDALLQDSYLLVVEVSRFNAVQESKELWARCLELVETLRDGLKQAGLSQRSMDLISHAQCALLDETVLSKCDKNGREGWLEEPLQTRLFNSHQAGESLYEQIRDVLREPSPDPSVLMVFHRVLMLGFKGRYHDLAHPEREQLLESLGALVKPLCPAQPLLGKAGRVRANDGAWLHSPWRHALTAGLLLASVWWRLDLVLEDLINTLLPNGV